MTKYLLLILLSSWSLLVSPSHGCDTGVAFVDSVLSVQRSLMAFADVAFLKSFRSPSVEGCMEDCCSGKFGECTVASFKKNSTKENCMHFYCRPLKKCKFLSSPSTDSFSFSSSPSSAHSVPSNHASTTVNPKTTPPAENSSESPQKKEEIATFSEEQFALKNDNTTVKARKGVHNLTPDDLLAKSGIKPRKGVTLEDVPHSKFLLTSLSKSNVKPRKGVGPYSGDVSPTPTSRTTMAEMKSSINPFVSSSHTDLLTTVRNSTEDLASDDLLSALEKVFEDDTHVESPTSSRTSSTSTKLSPTSRPEVTPTPSQSSVHSTTTGHFTIKPHITLHPSHSSSRTSLVSSQNPLEASSSSTPSMDTSYSWPPDARPLAEFTVSTVVSSSTTYFLRVAKTGQPTTLQPLETEILKDQQAKSVDELGATAEETENDRKYKSSIHLILSLVFGLLVLFAVLGVVAKRIYDGWLRRDYYRMNYLIDGIYNGVD